LNLKLPIKLLIKPNTNIAQGRNIAIEYAQNDIIASTDLGCILDKDWLKNIIEPFSSNSNCDVVAGWYEPIATTLLERCIADVSYPKISKIIKKPDNFLPSSRSIAFKKDCWKKVGGYPEWLYTAEDTTFDLNLKKIGCSFIFAPKAIVYWKTRSNIRNFLKQYYLYGKGDGEGRIFRIQYLDIYLSWMLGMLLILLYSIFPISLLILLILLMIYCFITIIIKDLNIQEGIIIKLMLNIMMELSSIIGYSRGLISRKHKNYKDKFE
jgi:cellulose synthase/poly-beta-1,6-N-acetylglucosamine synthase-like glycosyltransferase